LVESSTPNVLVTTAPTLTLTLNANFNIVGFELEPELYENEDVTASFFDGASLIDTIDLSPSGSSGALLFALQDTTPGAWISSVVITDNVVGNGGFAIAQLRAGNTPEPGTLSLLGLGMLGLAVLAYRKTINA
jgi:hypothetical protein